MTDWATLVIALSNVILVYLVFKQTSNQSKVTKLEIVTKTGEELAYLGRKFIEMYRRGLGEFNVNNSFITCDQLYLKNYTNKLSPKLILLSVSYLDDIALLLKAWNQEFINEINKLELLSKNIKDKSEKLKELVDNLQQKYDKNKCIETNNIILELFNIIFNKKSENSLINILTKLKEREPILILPLLRELDKSSPNFEGIQGKSQRSSIQ